MEKRPVTIGDYPEIHVITRKQFEYLIDDIVLVTPNQTFLLQSVPTFCEALITDILEEFVTLKIMRYDAPEIVSESVPLTRKQKESLEKAHPDLFKPKHKK